MLDYDAFLSFTLKGCIQAFSLSGTVLNIIAYISAARMNSPFKCGPHCNQLAGTLCLCVCCVCVCLLCVLVVLIYLLACLLTCLLAVSVVVSLWLCRSTAYTAYTAHRTHTHKHTSPRLVLVPSAICTQRPCIRPESASQGFGRKAVLEGHLRHLREGVRESEY
jgi:hypothetical protein